ncbi:MULTISPECIES: anthranilate synthase component II [Gracilibacillus]|uniref:Glutamine amidotransferase n=1 Tax=Gracilibacillus dipsosauri TaxID=178340 RepID=A0A317L2U0_9BACI|nr:aminodeoxychorismate/anthranilate synthase component II [Gracilibacillus dipsosauri]PWU69208.1 glutamine amidotransferase [Gracilibacillus dipsosauri]
MIIIIDNYDSFTYNLAQYYLQLTGNVTIFRNDQITIEELKALNPTLIVLSPGPGSPTNSGICRSILQHFFQTIPIFGVCLGMQIIVDFFGGNIIQAREPMHGKTSLITHDQTGIFSSLPSPLKVTRYHSLKVENTSFPTQQLSITATTVDDTIMGVRHKSLPIEGIQFHPEAILTEHGFQMVQQSYDHALRTEVLD